MPPRFSYEACSTGGWILIDNWYHKTKHYETLKDAMKAEDRLSGKFKSTKQKLRDKINEMKNLINDAVLVHPYNGDINDDEAYKWTENFDKIIEKYVRLRIKYHKFIKGII